MATMLSATHVFARQKLRDDSRRGCADDARHAETDGCADRSLYLLFEDISYSVRKGILTRGEMILLLLLVLITYD